jgi:hypothetical protein
MLASLVAIDRVEMCMRLCHRAQQTQQPHTYLEPTTSLLFHAVYSGAVESDPDDAIRPVHEVRYGPHVRAPERLMGCIRHTIGHVVDQRTARPDIRGVVLCGFHSGAIVAYCASVCVQRILACHDLLATDLPLVHCVTFGLPLFYAQPAHGIAEPTHVMMHDDWYVLTPFTLVLKPVPGLCWLGDEDLVSYVCNKIESLFRTVRSQRTMRDYMNAFMLEYEELLTTHRDAVVAPPPPSPEDEPTVVDVDWVDCADGSSEEALSEGASP